jgi:virulence-associated protein VagC
MGIFTELPEHITEVDIIVTGGKQIINPFRAAKS